MKPRGRDRLRSLCLATVLGGLFGLSQGGCLYDSDKPCGDDLAVYGDNLRCVCPEGTAYTPSGCVACGEHEVVTATGCACEDGFSRPAPGEACSETPSGLGADCDPAAPACEAPYDHCELASSGGYCTTSGCTTSADCEGGYACNEASVCQRPPVGLGTPCTGPADCAGTEATFCDLVVTMSCQVQGCQLDPNDCFSGFECCDLSMFGVPEPLCVAAGACMP
jgi:hypothetical protein